MALDRFAAGLDGFLARRSDGALEISFLDVGAVGREIPTGEWVDYEERCANSWIAVETVDASGAIERFPADWGGAWDDDVQEHGRHRLELPRGGKPISFGARYMVEPTTQEIRVAVDGVPVVSLQRPPHRPNVRLMTSRTYRGPTFYVGFDGSNKGWPPLSCELLAFRGRVTGGHSIGAEAGFHLVTRETPTLCWDVFETRWTEHSMDDTAVFITCPFHYAAYRIPASYFGAP